MCWPMGPWKIGVIAALFGFAPALASAAASRWSPTTSLLPPVQPACISSPFGARILPNPPLAGPFPNGVDLPAAVGSPVSAVAPGRVIRIQRHGVGGLEILIQHDGFVGVYSHIGIIAPVLAEGSKTIYGGERIATVGRSGLTYGPHLYFGIMVDGRAIDPAPYLKVGFCNAASASDRDTSVRPAESFAQH
jgi:murein DD-endopeptidase MepM/ murein hydrolase activator NlpD